MNIFFSDILNLGKVLICADGFIRGGNWNNGANTGAFTLNLNNAPSNTNTNIGFRCASDLENSSQLRQNERYIFKDLCPGFKRSQDFLHHGPDAHENIKPVFLYSISLEGRVNGFNIDKGRDIESVYSRGRSLGSNGLIMYV